jgi:3-hydroxybutyryl-CoA dehydrogenase
MEVVERVAVLGAGLMGHGIAQAFAQAGYPVTLYDISEDVLGDALRKITSNLGIFVEMGIEGPGIVEAVTSRIESTTSLEKSVRDAQFITEAAPEDVVLKKDLLKAIERYTGTETVIASNTSTLQLSMLGESMKARHRLIITHWFNPPYLIPVVEVVRGESTTDAVFDVTVELLKKIGKDPVHVQKEVAGFLVNRIQTAMFREVLSLLEAGVASAEDIDRAVKGSFGLRLPILGPLATADLGGLDVWCKGARHLYPSLDCSKTPHKVISEKVENGALGAKTGRGFYDYTADEERAGEIKARDVNLMRLVSILHSKKA